MTTQPGFWEESSGITRLGLALSGSTGNFLTEFSGVVDFVEIPFELVHYDQRPLELPENIPKVLHCASLSMAGDVRPSPEIVDAICSWAHVMETPWLGEHLAFVYAGPYDVGYALNPVTNQKTARRTIQTYEEYQDRFGIPILMENPPVYFEPPGSTLSMTEFIREVCNGSGARLLVDLAHLFISAKNFGLDPVKELLSLPLDRVDEVHISGVACRNGAWWDDHTIRAPDQVHGLLGMLLERTPIRAVTLEYNWSYGFPRTTLLEEIDRVRAAFETAGVV
jgi:hypothetical protein